MKNLYRKYLNGDLTRRHFLSALSGLGVSAYAASSLAQNLEAFSTQAADESAQDVYGPGKTVEGTGGELLVAQLLAADIKYIFINPSSSAGPVYDALVDTPGLQIIESVHEGNLLAMADGYARCSGNVPFVLISRVGLPSAMAQMYNSFKDNIPIVLAIDGISTDALGQAGFQDLDHREEMTHPMTKWHWRVQSTQKIPEVTRRAIKFATTQPCGPVFLSYPEDVLSQTSTAIILDQKNFSIPAQFEADQEMIQKAAALLLNARNPLLYVGSEITVSGAEEEVIELAELLGLPVVLASGAGPVHWSLPFPTRHPLYLGDYQQNLRYPGKVDVMLNLGGRMPAAGAKLKMDPGVRLIQVRLDAANLARNYPTEIPILADIKLAVQGLLAALHELASNQQLRTIRDRRFSKTQAFTTEMVKFHQDIAQERWNRYPISIERLLGEMEVVLEKDACIVTEMDSGVLSLHKLLSVGGACKHYLGNSGVALGWGLPAAFGAKLAKPDTPVVAIIGDGAFLFSGSQALWSYSRYEAPITVIVINNRSYNNERNRLWSGGGRQFESGRDMVCYIGNPDVNFVKLGEAFEVRGEVVDKADMIKGALERAKKANAEGTSYLLDVRVERGGIGALSTWHPKYSIAALRERKV